MALWANGELGLPKHVLQLNALVTLDGLLDAAVISVRAHAGRMGPLSDSRWDMQAW